MLVSRRSFHLMALGASAALWLPGCGSDSAEPEVDTDDIVKGTADKFAMPKALRDYQDSHGWGRHHIEWHTVRQWDFLQKNYPDSIRWAKSQGWERAPIQEGAKGNGLEFLAMHRAMLRHLLGKFTAASYKPLFAGWTTPPTDVTDKDNPVLDKAAFNPNMAKAIARVTSDLDFATDDDFGLYLETRARPGTGNGYSTDVTAGVHNYLHNRFSNSKSPTNLGDPEVNMKNKLFWRCHGWIDARWTAFRAAKGLKETDPAYKEAIDRWTAHMNALGGLKAGAPASREPRPDVFNNFWAKDELP